MDLTAAADTLDELVAEFEQRAATAAEHGDDNGSYGYQARATQVRELAHSVRVLADPQYAATPNATHEPPEVVESIETPADAELEPHSPLPDAPLEQIEQPAPAPAPDAPADPTDGVAAAYVMPDGAPPVVPPASADGVTQP